MTSAEYARRYAEMSDGELAKLISDGRDSLNDLARKALDQELQKRGLTEEQLAQEYPAERKFDTQQAHPQDAHRLAVKDFRLTGVRRWQLVVMGGLVAVGDTNCHSGARSQDE
jgi:hypothetical protein